MTRLPKNRASSEYAPGPRRESAVATGMERISIVASKPVALSMKPISAAQYRTHAIAVIAPRPNAVAVNTRIGADQNNDTMGPKR